MRKTFSTYFIPQPVENITYSFQLFPFYQDQFYKLLVEGFVKHLGGSLIPISSLVYLGEERSTALQADQFSGTSVSAARPQSNERTCHTGSLALPFCSAMDYYLGRQKDNQFDTCSYSLQHFDDSNLWSGLLCTSGSSSI